MSAAMRRFGQGCAPREVRNERAAGRLHQPALDISARAPSARIHACSAASAISKIAAAALGLPIRYTSAAAVWSRQMVSIPLRSNIAKARFSVIARRLPGADRSVTLSHFGFGCSRGGTVPTGQLNPAVLPEVKPSHSRRGCDRKHDHQKSQQFHSSPAGGDQIERI
jgi:hypothetical protein